MKIPKIPSKDNNNGMEANGQVIESDKVALRTRVGILQNALLRPFIIIAFASFVLLAVLISINEFVFSRMVTTQRTQDQLQVMSNSILALTTTRFGLLQEQLDGLAKSSNVQTALLNGDLVAFEQLAEVMRQSFNYSESLQIIPWDESGTAGLKMQDRSRLTSIDLMMISLAGGKKLVRPEAFIVDNKWRFAFISPVVVEDKVVGSLYLTLDKKMLDSVLAKTGFADMINYSLVLSDQANNPISSVGEVDRQNMIKTSMPFTNGELMVSLKPATLAQLQTRFYAMDGVLLFVALIISLFAFFQFRRLFNIISADIFSIQNYLESMSGLHKTQQPELVIHQLYSLLTAVESMESRIGKVGLSPASGGKKSIQDAPLPKKMGVADVGETHEFKHQEIFREYDIRGIAESQLTVDTSLMIGKAIASEAIAAGNKNIVVGRDGRVSSERIAYDLIRGIKSTGCNVINIGLVPTPAMYFAVEHYQTGAGVMITGSHNPAEYNGMKIVVDNKPFYGEQIRKLLTRIEKYDFVTAAEGTMSNRDVKPEYSERIHSDILITNPVKVVMDASNGPAGSLALTLFTKLDCETVPLNIAVDGKFPGHAPDPSDPANLAELIKTVIATKADLGVIFDGDADRMVAVTASGKIVTGDQLMMIFAKDIVSRNPASNVVYDVKCSKQVNRIISQFGGHPIMCKAGHSNIKAKMQDTAAIFGGELTGHYFFKERWYGFDDGIYAALRLLEIVANNNHKLDDLVAELPPMFITDEMVIPVVDAEEATTVINRLKDRFAGSPYKIDLLDGVRLDNGKSWALVRPSHTSTKLTCRFEADNDDDLEKIRKTVKDALHEIKPEISLPF